jgi:hypothetical protein
LDLKHHILSYEQPEIGFDSRVVDLVKIVGHFIAEKCIFFIEHPAVPINNRRGFDQLGQIFDERWVN